jgi:hypothetical protein
MARNLVKIRPPGGVRRDQAEKGAACCESMQEAGSPWGCRRVPVVQLDWQKWKNRVLMLDRQLPFQPFGCKYQRHDPDNAQNRHQHDNQQIRHQEQLDHYAHFRYLHLRTTLYQYMSSIIRACA